MQELEQGRAGLRAERDSLREERDSLRERLRSLESSRQELGEEFIILKSNYLALGRELDKEVRRVQGSSQSSSQGYPTDPAPPHLPWLSFVQPHHSSGPGRLLKQLYQGSC